MGNKTVSKGKIIWSKSISTEKTKAIDSCRTVDFKVQTNTVQVTRVTKFSIKEIMNISNILNSTLSMDEIKSNTLQLVTDLFNAQSASLYLYDPNNEELYFDVISGNTREELKTIRLKKWEGIAGYVITSGQSIIINNPKKDTRIHKRWEEKSGIPLENMMCTPIIAKWDLIWALQVINKKNGRFYQEELDLLSGIANNIWMAVSNARNYQQVKQKSIEIAKAYELLEQEAINTIETLAISIWARDEYTWQHTQRVMYYCKAIWHKLWLAIKERQKLETAALLHDIGKIWIKDSILLKDGKLTNEEYDEIQQHPAISAKLLSNLESLKDEILPAIEWHHERIDGNGYPNHLKWDEIPFLAKIISIADAFDAMTTDRPYRKWLSKEIAIERLIEGKGTQFDAKIVDTFVQFLNEIDLDEFKNLTKWEI